MRQIWSGWGAAIIAAWMMAISAMAWAEPGDAEAVAKARKDYAEAMKGHDPGLQNAMRVELNTQLAKAKERAKSNKKQARATPNPQGPAN